ncbi:MAG: Plug domain-containing protein [Sphingopyxis sp.]|uniref:Plug domain-containing protein n=1 Tax=Sphingopyxis sp. TaxID=1908224 RepID=UPI001A5ABC95|nr:Plug domain-containing protein [Sphingopyxis sp.]MBL9068839.1 Plug domain-containing protein [Sphingopyxis sp.]
MHIVNQLLSTAALIQGLCLAVPTAAQEAAGEGRTAYASDFFSRSQPTSAHDMVVLLPGFRLVEGDTELRGYSGASGNVLVDGQRPAGKAETLEEVLKRIPATRVERIELVRAGAPGVDMQGYVSNGPLIAGFCQA